MLRGTSSGGGSLLHGVQEMVPARLKQEEYFNEQNPSCMPAKLI